MKIRGVALPRCWAAVGNTGRDPILDCFVPWSGLVRVRNQRDAAHLDDGIDPNLQDATLVGNTP